MAVKEGKWRCQSCDNVNLGRDMKCGSCGAVRGEDVEFFIEDDAAEVSDESLLSTAAAGADWHCEFCGTDNRASMDKCKQCGAPAEGMKRRQGAVQSTEPQVEAPQPTATKKSPLPIILGVIAVVAAVFLVMFFLGGKEDYLQLQSGEWTRSIEVERQELKSYEAWRDQVPTGGVITRTWEAQRSTEKVQIGTEQVKTGTRDMGNGFFEDVYEDRPVYEERAVMDIKADYEILEWTVYRTEKSMGDLDDTPQWPNTKLRHGDREGRKSERALLFFSSTDPEKAGELYSYDKLSPEEMNQFQRGVDYKAVVAGDSVRRFLEEDE